MIRHIDVQHLSIREAAPLLPGRGKKEKIIATRMALDWSEEAGVHGAGLLVLGEVPSRINDSHLDG